MEHLLQGFNDVDSLAANRRFR